MKLKEKEIIELKKSTPQEKLNFITFEPNLI